MYSDIGVHSLFSYTIPHFHFYLPMQKFFPPDVEIFSSGGK